VEARIEEAKYINKSVAALGNCIQALSNRKPKINNYPPTHIPYRDSKLTRIIFENGNTKTSICVCVSPSNQHYDETFSSLLFGHRAMMIKVDSHKNEEVFYKVIDHNFENFMGLNRNYD
jgi:hypothetical protein